MIVPRAPPDPRPRADCWLLRARSASARAAWSLEGGVLSNPPQFRRARGTPAGVGSSAGSVD